MQHLTAVWYLVAEIDLDLIQSPDGTADRHHLAVGEHAALEHLQIARRLPGTVPLNRERRDHHADQNRDDSEDLGLHDSPPAAFGTDFAPTFPN